MWLAVETAVPVEGKETNVKLGVPPSPAAIYAANGVVEEALETLLPEAAVMDLTWQERMTIATTMKESLANEDMIIKESEPESRNRR